MNLNRKDKNFFYFDKHKSKDFLKEIIQDSKFFYLSDNITKMFKTCIPNVKVNSSFNTEIKYVEKLINSK